jgi:predicted O-linked N-acetylglucosamine transferase (SPINDLY family)
MKPGRNDPCSCGSGKKFKHCCEGKVASRANVLPASESGQLVALYNTGRYAELEGRARSLVGQYPGSGFVWKLLAASLQKQGKNALTAFQKTAELMHGDAEAHFNLGVVQKNLGQLGDAVTSFRRALKINPGHAVAHSNLAAALYELGKINEAVASYRQVVALKSDSAVAHNNLGAALYELGLVKEAVASCRRAVELNSEYAEAYNNLGTFLKELSQYDDAEEAYRKALKLNPDNFKAHGNLGNLFLSIGKLDEAIASYRSALEIKPDLTEALSNLLFVLNYSSSYSPEYCLEQARLYGRIVTEMAVRRFSDWQCTERPERLRVGLVSGDLRVHSVGHFLEGLLSHLDPARIELIVYPTHHKDDELTARIRPLFSAWRPLLGKSDEDAARLIHADGVHVLMDISGHTALNKLPVFAWKPAPVQLTWLGFPHTTGVKEIDYILGDLQAIPLEHENHFTEMVWRLPDSYLCFSAPPYPVNVAPLPALSMGHVTFGSFNNLTKMNDAVVELWARILLSVPNSHLYLKTSQLSDENIREQTRQRFAVWGIAQERLILGGKLGTIADHLAEYNKVDVALDTFPYPGVTTSVEALWMGVPVLTLHGDRFLSLTAKSVAHHAGLPDWVAFDLDDFVTKAVAFTSNIERLAALRAGLRQLVVASPLFNAPRFARNFEDALWGMWQARDGQG